MYYSNEGVSFEPTVKACNRESLFTNIFNSSDLNTEASRFAHVLSLRQITVYIPVEEMERITDAAVTAFTTYLRKYIHTHITSWILFRLAVSSIVSTSYF